MSRNLLPHLLLALATLGCSGRALAPDERVIHVRELLAASPDGRAVLVLEAVDADGAAPRATLSRWAAGRRELLATATPEEARAIAAQVAAEPGAPDRTASLPARFRAAVREGGFAQPGPAAEGPPWRPPGLPDTRLERRLDDDPRYGPTVRLVLRDEAGREEEVARFPGREPPALELRFLAGNRAAATVRPPPVPGAAVADFALLDLGPAAGRLLAAEAGALAASGDPAAARRQLARARELAPGEPAIPYREALVAAAAGDSAGAVAALARAIALEPSVYRMRARTEPAFAALRDDPAFVELVRPRPLP